MFKKSFSLAPLSLKLKSFNKHVLFNAVCLVRHVSEEMA